MTVQELIKAALRKLTVIATGETPSSEIMQDSLETMNMMLQSWALEGIVVKGLTKESLSLTIDTGEYSWGTGGDFTTAPPDSIISASIKSGDTEYHLTQIGPNTYHQIADKTVTGIPDKIHLNPTRPTATVNLFPVPDSSGYTLEINTIKPITEFSSLTGDVTIPDSMLMAVKQNLTIELAAEYGRPLTQTQLIIANESKKAVRTRALIESLSDETPATVFSKDRKSDIFIGE